MPGDGSATQAERRPAQGWLRGLDEYDVRFLVLDLDSDRKLVEFFQSQPGWTVDFEDGEAVLFVRADVAQA